MHEEHASASQKSTDKTHGGAVEAAAEGICRYPIPSPENLKPFTPPQPLERQQSPLQTPYTSMQRTGVNEKRSGHRPSAKHPTSPRAGVAALLRSFVAPAAKSRECWRAPCERPNNCSVVGTHSGDVEPPPQAKCTLKPCYG